MAFDVGLRDNGVGAFDINLLQGGTPPTVVLNLLNDTSISLDATPTLNFTGTDAELDTLEYNVQIDTVNTFDSSRGSDTVTDTYPFSNVDGGVIDMDSVDAPRLCRLGETFMARISGVLSNATFALAKVGTPPDNIVVRLYSITGTSGTNAKPTGSALVSSSAILASSLPGGGNNITFDFSGTPYTLTAGLYYAIVVEYDSTNASVANHMTIFVDGTTPTHDGNGVVWSAGLSLWGYLSSNQKIPFIVNVKPIVPLISKFSEISDPGFTANHPYSGNGLTPIDYAVQSPLDGGTYYWRVAAKDVGATGTGNYGAWSSIRSFTIVDQSGISQPVYVGQGVFQYNTTTLTVPVPVGLRNNDLMLLFVETANQAITTPTGWTQLANSPQGIGPAGLATGVMLEVYYKIAYGNEGSVTVAATANHQTAIIMAYRNVDPAAPINITAGSTDGTTFSMSFPSITTTVKNTLIVLAAAMDTDANSSSEMGTVTNPNLISITDRFDQTVNTGAGGGLVITEGIKPSVGATGVSTATAANQLNHAYLTIALQGMAPTVRVVGQYRDDESMVIPTGSRTFGDGITNNVGLLAEYVTGSTDVAITPSLENELVATDFNYISNNTLRAMEQQSTDIWSSRRSGNMVYDPDNKRYVFFGGYDGTARWNEVWVQYTDVPGQPWRKLTVTGTPPNIKNLAGATLIRANLTAGGALRSYMLVWGGVITDGSAETNEMQLLRLDTVGSEAWTTVAQTSAPTVRSWISGHMVSTPVSGFSDRNYVYLFGGWAATRENALYRCTIDVDSPATTTWTTLKADLAVGNPNIRSGAIMAYKAATNKLYLYGGYDGTSYLSDFWEYDVTGNTWTNTSPTGTAPVGTELMAGGYDSVKNRFWFTGGWTSTGQTTGRNNIGYINNVGGSESYVEVRANTAIDTGNQAYIGFSSPSFAIDTDRRLLVIRSVYDVDSTDHYHYAIDLDDNSTSNMPVYGFAEGEYLSARDAAASVYNPDRNEWLIIGGFANMYDDTTIPSGCHNSSIWVYSESTNTWRYANKGAKTLLPHEGRVACYDTVRKRILVFGGLSGSAQVSNEVWQLVADNNGQYKATKLATAGTPPASRWLGICAYDVVHNRMIVGLGADDTATIYNDMYSLDFTSSASGAWTTLNPTGTLPTAVVAPAYFNYSKTGQAYSNRLYVFGGATNILLTTTVNQLVCFDYSTVNGSWLSQSSSGGTARRGMGFALDDTNNQLIIWGGFDGSNSLTVLQYFSLAGTTWVSATPANMPTARRSLSSMFLNGKMCIFGGRPVSGMWFNDTWQLTPNYSTPNNSTWANMYPKAFNPIYFTETSLTNLASYHWQAWAVESGLPGVRVSYGGNAESAADYIIGHTGYIKANTADEGWLLKPIKVYIGGTWVIKPVKVYDGSGWVLKN
jgi:hypothetical protein